MKLETFFEKFDQFADAPNAVAKMRELVLQLAVTGKLVPQDTNDEPAESILRTTRAFFDHLIAAKKLSSPKPLPEIDEEQVPFSLPRGWAWCRLGQLLRISSGDALTAENMNAGAIPVYGGNGVTGYHDSHNTSKPTLIIGRVGFYCGSVHVSPEKAWVTDNAFITTFDEEHMSLHFLKWLLKATDLRERDNATAQPVISGGKIYPVILGIPPLAEQERIVVKVDELMALCDQLEAQLQERETRHATLARAALARFAEAPTPDNLKLLFHDSFTIEPTDLRKTILALAVQGKLISQDTNDEGADKLLLRIAATKLRLQKEGKIGKEKPVHSVRPKDLPFDLPESWRWSKLADLTELITKGSSPKWQGIAYLSEAEGVLFITSENVGNYRLRKLDDLKYVDKRFNEIEPRSILKHGDILLNLVGASIGRTAIYDLHDGANINQAVALIRLVRETEGIYPNFLLHYLNSSYAIEMMLSSRVVTAQPNISLTDTREFVVPIPPLAEQRRIVAKVDQLMGLVDQLEAQLAAARVTATSLMNAMVAELTLKD